MTHLSSKNGYSVDVLDALTPSQIDRIRMVLYDEASTCNPDWVHDVLTREDVLKSSLRMIALARTAIEAGKPQEADKWLKVVQDRFE